MGSAAPRKVAAEEVVLDGCALSLELPSAWRLHAPEVGARFASVRGASGSLLIVTCQENIRRTFDRRRIYSRDEDSLQTAVRVLSEASLAVAGQCVSYRKIRISAGSKVDTLHAYCAVRDFEYHFALVPGTLEDPARELAAVLSAGRFVKVQVRAISERAYLIRLAAVTICGVVAAILAAFVTLRRWRRKALGRSSDTSAPH